MLAFSTTPPPGTSRRFVVCAIVPATIGGNSVRGLVAYVFYLFVAFLKDFNFHPDQDTRSAPG